MTWNLNGQYYESCSCAMACRCALGPTTPDQGWCSAIQLVEVQSGSLDGLDLAGARYAVAMQLPGDFFGGIEKARLYFDETRTSERQRSALAGIYRGDHGGIWGDLAAAIAEWLPAKTARFSFTEREDGVSASMPGVGTLELTWLRTPDGRQAKLVNAPVMASLGVYEGDLALANGSAGTDPDLRGWESLGFGARVPFSWSA